MKEVPIKDGETRVCPLYLKYSLFSWLFQMSLSSTILKIVISSILLLQSELWTNHSQNPFSLKAISRLYLWEAAWHSDNDWWPATYNLGTFSKQGRLWASETVIQLHYRIDVSIWWEYLLAHNKQEDTTRKGVDYSCKSQVRRENGDMQICSLRCAIIIRVPLQTR